MGADVTTAESGRVTIRVYNNGSFIDLCIDVRGDDSGMVSLTNDELARLTAYLVQLCKHRGVALPTE